ncbi:PH domain-containing protein [Allosalinactinospora lopnorensis]|uniref:PH domain-containing protein n=1 Tax=Allosalinactinospora lopnorensis TaxID=1352348 RepID=UPI000623BF2E|nr:PH domain-containing protein [Allosalinactinospora lopnorensis]
MAIADRYLADDEELVHVTRQHWSTLIGEFLLLLVIIAAAAGLLWVLPSDQEWGEWAVYAVLGLAVLAALVFWLVPLLKWWNTVYILSSRRLMERYGLVSKHGRDMPLTRVNDVTFSISLWERIMRYGTLSIQSASEQDGMVLERVPHVEWLQSEIYRQVNEAQRREFPPGQWGQPPDPGY